MNKMRLALVVAGALAVAGAAKATTTLQYMGVTLNAADAGNGLGHRFTFAGVSDGAGATRQFSNIGGQVTYRLVSVTHAQNGSTWTSSWRLLLNITNTSTAPMTSSRISGVGFSMSQSASNDTHVPIASSQLLMPQPEYDLLVTSNAGLNIPNVANSNSPQVCLKASGNLNNCGGGGGDGLQMNTSAGAGLPGNPFPSTSAELILNFSGPAQRTSLYLNDLVLRFQSLSGTGTSSAGNGTLDGDSGVGIVVGHEIVPEPSSWAMLITGFGLVGASMRRRRAQAA